MTLQLEMQDQERNNPANVPEGYKWTEVGVIPEDWEVLKLGEQAIFRTGPFGSMLHKSDYINDGIPLINPMHIVNGKLNPSPSMSVSEEAAKKLAIFKLKADDIVIGRRGDMGRCAIVYKKQEGWLCGTGSLIISCKTSLIPEFIQLLLTSPKIIAAIEDASVGSTMINLNQATLSSLRIQYPPLPEQRAIAAALSDVDGLIEALEKLIAKKRDIKLATMQQLLTGKTRLPGFSGEWELKRLGNMLTFLKTANNPRADLNEYSNVEYIHYGDIHSYNKPILDCSIVNLSRIEGRKVVNADCLENGDLVIVDASEDLEGVGKSIEVQGVAQRRIVAGLHTILCRGNAGQWAMRFKAYLQFIPAFKTALLRVATGISVYAISKKQIADVELALPSIDEQQAIASVLSDMDAEIEALEQRLEKTKQIKQGMMQQLLTGRVRLV